MVEGGTTDWVWWREGRGGLDGSPGVWGRLMRERRGDDDPRAILSQNRSCGRSQLVQGLKTQEHERAERIVKAN